MRRIAGTGYIRHRDLEFTDTGKPKERLLKDFDRRTEMVVATIQNQAAADWSAPYFAEREPKSKDRFAAILRYAAHADHHVGQIIYLQKEWALPAAARGAD